VTGVQTCALPISCIDLLTGVVPSVTPEDVRGVLRPPGTMQVQEHSEA